MDYPYLLNYFVMLILAYFYWKKPDPKIVKWAFALEFIFIALRAPVVGADTWNYVRYLDGERNFYNGDAREFEPGFLVYRQLMVALHPARWLVMVINNVLLLFPIYVMMKRYSKNVPLSLAMLSIYNIYYTYFCGLRQILGLAILFVGVLYVLDEKRAKWGIYALCAFLGYQFHTTIVLYAIIFAAAYFVRFKSRTILIAVLVVSAVMGIVLQSFNVMDAFNYFLSLNFEATERIENYMEEGNDVNEITNIFQTLRPTIIAVFVVSLMDKDKLNHWFSIIYSIGVILGNLFISVPMIGRMTTGMLIFGPIVFTWILCGQYQISLKVRKVTNVALVIFLLYFSQAYYKNNQFAVIDLRSSSRMHPYQFVWEDYSNHPSIKYWN